MTKSIFVELLVLSTKTTAEEQIAFQRALAQYEEDMQEWRENEEISRLRGVEKPEFPHTPGSAPTYTPTFINMGDDFKIESWIEEYDEKNQCSVIIVQYNTGAETEIMNVKTTKPEWIELLKSLGSVVYENHSI